MDVSTIAQIPHYVRKWKGMDLVRALSELCTEAGRGRSSTVRFTKDQINAVLNDARAGRMHVIGEDPNDQAVILSMRELAALLQAAAGTFSFGTTLEFAGFTPVSGHLELPDQRRPRESFTIYGQS